MNLENSISRKDKLTFIGFPHDQDDNVLTDEALNSIYNKMSKQNKKTDKPDNKKLKELSSKGQFRVRNPKCEKIDIDCNKYKVFLKFLNDLLKKMNRNVIADITQFKNIRRDDLLKEACDKALNENINDIIKHFGRSKIRYHEKDKHKCYVLAVIKYLVSLCGYQFVINTICKWDITNEMSHEDRYSILYSIL